MMALASTQMKAGQLDNALANYNKAAALCTKFNYELGLAQLYADLGLLLQGLGQFSEAEQMLLKSFTVAEKLEEIAIASVAAGNLALLYRETQDLDRAEEHGAPGAAAGRASEAQRRGRPGQPQSRHHPVREGPFR